MGPIPTQPTTDELNNQYVITTLLTDPSLNTLFTVDNYYNKQWNKATLIETIKDILANGTEDTPSLSQVTYTPPNPEVTLSAKPGSQSYILPFLPNNKNIITIKDTSSKTYNFTNEGIDTKGQDGSMTMKLDNYSILAGSDISFAYNIPKNVIKDSNGNFITLNSGNPKCVYKTLCTEKHFYKRNCKTSFSSDGSVCNCNCSNELVLGNGEPHTHCETKDLSNSIINYLSDISSVKMSYPVPTNLKNQNQNQNQNLSDTITYDPDLDHLTNLIANYYILLIINKEKQKKQKESNNLTDGQYQSRIDSNELYQGEYIKLINISVGIFATTFILYSLIK
jgi:hypothetical protein